EHPYIQAEIDGFTVDFVPCFKLESADKVVSSVDRTPFHTLYVKSRITEKTKNEVRLLKRFMRGIGTYGAEIKIGGFSGYLCEILILYYKSFVNLLTAASDWRKQEIIDLEGYYTNREEDARKLFQEPLIVVDPVDKSRNVASAVKEERLSEFIAAARQFLKNPSLRFFYPEPVKPLPIEEIIRTMDARGTSLVFLKTVAVRAVPDVLWGQLYRSQRAIAKTIRRYGFSLLRDDVWSDEKTAIVFVFELHSRFLPTVEKHLGPPVRKREDCERFLTKHLGSNLTLSGPRIEGDRWVVERKRRFTDVVELLKTNLENEASNTGIASQISKAFLSQLEVWVNHEVKHFYLTNPSFALFLTEYLRGKPRWLQ
ncbi:CCA tRNA nucleotidyltransferase, partial [Candidatus Bathyarchaeota archaeon]